MDLGNAGRLRNLEKRASKRKFLTIDTCGQDASVAIKKAGQKVVSHPGVETETCRPRSKCLSITLCKEFEHKVV